MLFNYLSLLQKKSFLRTFLRIQWLRFMLPMQGVLVWSLSRELRSHMLHSITKKETKRNIFYYQGQRRINIDTSVSWQELVSWPFLDTGETENCIPWHSTHCLAATLLCGREAESLVENQYSLPHCAALGLFSCIWLFATLWTVDHQAPLSMGWDSPGKNTGVGCHAHSIRSSRGSYRPSGKTHHSYVSCIGRQLL